MATVKHEAQPNIVNGPYAFKRLADRLGLTETELIDRAMEQSDGSVAGQVHYINTIASAHKGEFGMFSVQAYRKQLQRFGYARKAQPIVWVKE